MMLHIDGSQHRWFQDERQSDLIVILDDATSEIYHAFSGSTVRVPNGISRQVLSDDKCPSSRVVEHLLPIENKRKRCQSRAACRRHDEELAGIGRNTPLWRDAVSLEKRRRQSDLQLRIKADGN